MGYDKRCNTITKENAIKSSLKESKKSVYFSSKTLLSSLLKKQSYLGFIVTQLPKKKVINEEAKVMLEVFICEDDQRQRLDLEKIIQKYIFMENLEMKLTLSTKEPKEVLNYLKDNPKTIGLYFLDIDLGCAMTGIDLAIEIRKLDVLGKIVFITTHGEMMHLTFFHHIEAMDYILKGQVFEDTTRRVISCLKGAYDRYLTEQSLPTQASLFKVKIAGKTHVYQLEDVIFFTSIGSHKLALHLKDSKIEFSGSMKEVESYSTHFVRIHTSYTINILNIKNIANKQREITMINGEKCFASVRGMQLLKRVMKNLEIE